MNLIKSILLTSVLLVSSTAFASDNKLSVPFYYQDDACWCGVAVAEMVIQYVKDQKGEEWKWYPERQSNLATFTNVGTFVGTDKNLPGWPCGPKGGVSRSELISLLGKRLGSGRYSDASSPISNGVSKDFHTQVIRGIKDKSESLPVNGHTRYRDGSKAIGMHWYLIVGYRDSDNNANTVDPDNDGYYLYDAAYNSPAAGRLVTISKGKFVSHRNFLILLANIGDRVYYAKRS